jgi:hypothetical protein
MRTDWLRAGTAGLASLGGGALAFVVGGQWLPAYLLVMTVVVPAAFVAIARPWRLRAVLMTAAGTLFGPALVLSVPVTYDVIRGEEPLGMLVAGFFATMLYFTGLATLVGLLACMALSMLTDEYGRSHGREAHEPS